MQLRSRRKKTEYRLNRKLRGSKFLMNKERLLRQRLKEFANRDLRRIKLHKERKKNERPEKPGKPLNNKIS